MKMFRRWRYPFFEFCLRFWNLAAAIFLVLRISATRKGASYPPTKRVYSLIEFLLDSAKRQNYAVCMCVCRFYIYLRLCQAFLIYINPQTPIYTTTESIFIQEIPSISRTHRERLHILITNAPVWLQFYGAIHTHRYTSSLWKQSLCAPANVLTALSF